MTNKSAVKFLWLAFALLIAGCATYETAWDHRVGAFTYNQAVNELGPPDQRATLADGQTEADWISRYSTGTTARVGTGFMSGPSGAGAMSSYHQSTLRLTFGTNNVLTAWARE